jgi:hypothetical protein
MTWRLLEPVRRRWTLLEGGLSPTARDARTREDTDARVLSIVQSSGLARMIDRLLATVIVAGRHSAVAALSRQVFDRAGGGAWPDRARLGGSTTVIASATALVLQRLGSRPAPLGWIVPALMLIVGVCLFALARVRAERQP